MKSQDSRGARPQDGALPLLPRPGAGTDAEALQRLRRFHVDPTANEGPAPEAGMLPALLAPFRGIEELRSDDPFFVGGGDAEGALCLTLPELLGRLAPAADAARILADNLLRLERRVRRRAAGLVAPADARELLREAGEDLVEELKLGDEDRQRLERDLEALRAAVPAGGRFIPFGPDTPLHLLLAAASMHLEPAREAFAAEVRELASLLSGMLESDRRKGAEGRAAGTLGAGMGQLGSRFVNTEALAGALGGRRGGSTLSAERRRSLDQALSALEEYGGGAVEPVLVHDPAEGKLPRLDGVREVKSKSPLAAALEVFDEEAGKIAGVLRAVRVARLETQGKYDPERHDPWLARLDWQAFSREELNLLPTVVVRVSADAVARRGLLELSQLLLSGRPVQVLLGLDPVTNPGTDPETDPLSGFRFEPGYLGVSLREAMVQQGSAARPALLMEGFRRALAGTRGALHVAAAPTADAVAADRARAWLASGAVLEGRALPVFRYDPEAGFSWARRLDFAGNPSAEDDWPADRLACRAEDGREQSLDLVFTFADCALLHPAYRPHFQPVPGGVPEAELMALSEWLEEAKENHTVPFIWGVDGEGRMQRLAVSRPLALACRDRLSFWRTLQELAGVKSEYVREAEERLRREAEERITAERERLIAQQEAELARVKATAAVEVANQLTAALLEVDVSAFGPPAAAAGGFGNGFAGRSVDEVTQQLLALVDPGSFDAAAGAGGAEVEKMTAQLLQLMGTDIEEA